MISIDPQLIREVVENGKRLDNRRFEEYRNVTVEKNAISSAEGSARVHIGNTEVVVGVKFGVGTPFADTPDEGVLMVSTELLPLASPDFESGPPREEAIEISRVVDRAIRESKVIDFKKLCITPKEKVWMMYIDIDVLDDDGNLIDAASLAAAAALASAKLPKLDEEGAIDYDQKGIEPLPMEGIPVSTTFVKIGNTLLADPSLLEISAMDARLTIGTFEKDGEVLLSSMQKGGPEGFTIDEIEKIMELAERKGAELRALI